MADDQTGFNTNIRVGKRKLHIQTSFEPEIRSAKVSIFDGGKLVDSREMILDESVPDEQTKAEVKQFHYLVISDLELLFHIVNKVSDSKNAASIARLGNLFLEKGFYQEAVDTFNGVLKLNPNYENCRYYLGQACYKLGDYESAAEHLNTAIEQTPNYPDVHFLLGHVYRNMDRSFEAIEAVRKAISLNKDYHQALHFLGVLLIESTLKEPKHPDLLPPIERIKEAKKKIKRAFTIAPQAYDTKLVENAYGLLEDRDEIEDAVSELERVQRPLAAPKKSAVANSEFYLKFMFAGLDKDNHALENYITALEKSVVQHPSYADLRRSLGTAFLIKGWHFFGRAMEEYREAVKINPDYEKAQKHLKLLENDGRGFLMLLRAILK